MTPTTAPPSPGAMRAAQALSSNGWIDPDAVWEDGVNEALARIIDSETGAAALAEALAEALKKILHGTKVLRASVGYRACIDWLGPMVMGIDDEARAALAAWKGEK